MRILIAAVALIAAAQSAGAQALAPLEHYRLRLRADSLLRSANGAQATELYRRLIANEPRDGGLWFALGQSLFARDPQGAAEAFERANQLGGVGQFMAPQLLVAARIHAPTNPNRALDLIERALEQRLPNREQLRNDSALVRALGKNPRFRKLAGVPPANPSRDEGWRFDLDYFVEEARRLLVSFNDPALPAAFESGAAALRTRIPRLTDEQIETELRRLATFLGDGHTGVFSATPSRRLPITLYWFRDGIVVVGDQRAGNSDLIGARILAINGTPIDQAVARLSEFIARDNDMSIRAIAPGHLTTLTLLRATGLVRDTTGVELTIAPRTGAQRTVRLAFGEPRGVNARVPISGDSARRPLWLQAPNNPYWYRYLPEANAVYLQFNAVRNQSPAIPEFARELRRVLEQNRATSLIVDVRHNGGGNSYLFPPLVKTMIVFREESPEHRVFVIQGRHTFSAAQNFVVAVDQWVGATFVGEPSGSRINFVGESNTFSLPVNGTRANISWRWHQYGQWVDTRPWIAPSIPAELTSTDFFEGRDPALEAVIALLRKT